MVNGIHNELDLSVLGINIVYKYICIKIQFCL